MAGMKFNADIDLEKIVKLRQEIDKLKKSLIAVASVPNSDAAIKQLESEIDRATKKLSEYKDQYVKLQKIKYDIDSSSITVKRVKEETSALQSTNKWIIANTESVKEADRQIKQLKKDFSALSDEEKVGDTGTAKIRQIQQLAAQRLVEEEAVRKTIKAQKDQIIQSNAEEGSITALRKQLILLIKDYDDLGRVRRGGDAGKALLTQISNVQKELNAAEQASGRFQRNVGNYASAWNGLGNSVQQVARELPSLAVSANTFFLAISNNLPILVDEIAKARKEYANFKAELKAGNKDVKAVAPVWQQLAKSILSWQTALVVGLTLLSVYGKDVIKWIGSLGKARDVTLDLLSAEQEMALARKSAWSSIAKEQTQLDILYNKLKNVTLSTTERNAAVREWVKNYKTHSDILDGENVDLRKLENAYRALSKEIYANAVARAYADRIAELSVQREKEETKRLNQKLTIAKAEQELERVTAEYNKKENEGFGTATAKLEAKDRIIQARKNVEDQKKIYNDLVNNINDYDKNITVISNHIKTLDLFPQPKEGTYDYWKQQVEIADDALKQITSEQKKVLDEASKDAKKDLYGLGIDKAVVDSYKKAVKDKAEAEKQLKVYGDPSKEQKMAEKEAEKRKKEQKKLNEELLSLRRQNQQAEIDLMEEGTEKKLKQINLDYQKELDAIKKQEKLILSLNDKNKVGDKMLKLFGNGNVDLLARPLVDAAELVKKGWEDAGEGIATVFSSQFGIEDAEGKQHEILITPILPDGTILSPEELEQYIDNSLNGAEDILSSDTKGIVIKVDASIDGNDGELLHQLQEKYYDIPQSVLNSLSQLYSNATNKRNKDISNVVKEQLKAEQQALNDYLKEYGTYQEKKLAITQEYEEKIKKAQNQWEAKSLQKELEEELSSINLAELKQNFSWDSIFGNLSLYSSQKLKELRSQLKELLENDKSLSVSDKTALIEQYNRLGDAIIKDQNALGKLFGYKTEQQSQVQLLKEEYDLRKNIYDKLVEEQQIIQKRYSDSKTNLESFLKEKGLGTDNSTMDVDKILSMFSSSDVEGMEKFQSLFSAFSKSGKELSNITSQVDKAGKSMDSASEAFQGAGSNMASTVSMIDTIVHEINDNVQSANELIKILELEDTKFGEGFDSFAKSSQYATQAWESLKSGNIMGVAAGVAGSIKELGNAIGSWFGLNANYSDYNEMVAKYDVLLDVWDQLLDKKKAYINESYGAEATKAGKEALDLLKAERDITRELASSRLDAGAGAGSHSMAYRMWQGSYKYEGQNWKDVAGEISSALGGVEFSSMWNLLYMSADQLEWIKTNYSGLWSQMDTDFRGYLDDIIQYGETEVEIIESVKEQITGISFDSFRDSYVSLLSDLDSTNKDFADSFEDYLRKSILQSVIAKNYNTKIQELYDSWSKAGEDGLFSESEVERLRAMQQSITDAMLEERDRLEEVFGWSSSSSQEASKKGSTTASQDSIDELNGRFTALQIAGEEIKNQNQLQTMSILELRADMLPIIANTTGIKDIASETRDLLRLSYEELTGIHDDTTSMNKSLKNIETDISEVKRNTSKL